MKTCTTVLVLLALCTLALPCLAQTEPAAPVPTDVAGFLATLSGDQAKAPEVQGLQPGPNFLSTTCTDSSQCPAGQLCCYPCGIEGCDFICMTPVRKRCPFFP